MARHHSDERSNDLTYIRGMGSNGQPTDFTNGIRLMPWQNRTGPRGEQTVTSTDVVHMLGTTDPRTNRVMGPFKPIPIQKDQPPILSRDGNRAFSGTFKKVDQGGVKKLVLRTREEDDNAFYVHVQTGFSVDSRGTIEGDLNKLILESSDGFQIATPGSFTLDGASAQLEASEGLEFGSTPAERLRWSASKAHGLIGAPGVRHDLWRIPEGAAVLVQDVNGILFRIVNEKSELKVVDASKYAGVFNDLEQKRRAEAAKARAAYHAARDVQKRSSGGVILPNASDIKTTTESSV
jgi:hypothetical protein